MRAGEEIQLAAEKRKVADFSGVALRPLTGKGKEVALHR